jgi:hypothetical protein
VVLERHVSDEQAASDLEAIRSMWELAAVYEFMGQFKFWLNFSQLYPLQDLEEALVRSPGPGAPARGGSTDAAWSASCGATQTLQALSPMQRSNKPGLIRWMHWCHAV